MSHYPKTVRNLIRQISKLPGIGEKTAERLAMHVLRSPRGEAEQLARAILDIKDRTGFCTRCFALSDGDVCEICSHPGRDRHLLCVVEHPADMVAVEKAGAFPGVYHILQGALSPMDGVGPDQLRIRELYQRIDSESIAEVVIATGTGVEGEATAAYIAEQLASRPVRVTRIASGVPIGGDLKFVDQMTLKRAMEARRAV
jgi:recombination protein RecR